MDRRYGFAVAFFIVIALVAVLVMRRGPQTEGVERGLEILQDGDRFDEAQQAGEAFALVASAVLSEGEECREEHGEIAMCDARFSAGGFAQVFAVAALDCSQPAIHRGRTALREHLDEIAQLGPDADEAPPIPPVPDC